MSYPRFFIDFDGKTGDFITLSGESALHISRSLRMRAGEKIICCNQDGTEFLCELTSFSSDTVEARVDTFEKSKAENEFETTLYQCCTKGEKMEFVIQKAVETGVDKIVPVLSDRCIVKYSEADRQKKITRWQKIALEAAKQSGRGKVPEVCKFCTFDEAVKSTENKVAFICYEDEERLSLKDFFENNKENVKNRGISFFVGPEGGISDREIETCKKFGISSVSLGKRILRTETAALYVLSCIGFEFN